ncbi:MAG: hypothetical protein ACE5I7_06855 [Candidatus Binatia bacterium]
MTDGTGGKPAGTGAPEERQTAGRWGKISRRNALLFLGGGAGTALVAVVVRGPARLLLQRAAATEHNAGRGTGRLSEPQLDTLAAFGQVLIPSGFAASGSAADTLIRRTLEERATEPATAAEFQEAVAFLDRRSFTGYKLPFVKLAMPDRRQLANDLLKPYTTRTLLSIPRYHLTAGGRRVRHLWHSVATPLIARFYTSSFGWQVVGYARRPGECSNLIDYQFPPAPAGRRLS